MNQDLLSWWFESKLDGLQMGNKKKRDSFEALNLAGINLIQFQYEIALKKKRKKKGFDAQRCLGG
jgi:hypothetical protein